MLDQQKQGDQKSEVANPVDDEGFLPGRRRRIFREPEADQQVGRQPHAFPPDEHLQVVARQHQREHEKHEQVEVGEEAIEAAFLPHVAHRIDVNQEADPGHDQQHHQCELIEIELEICQEDVRSAA